MRIEPRAERELAPAPSALCGDDAVEARAERKTAAALAPYFTNLSVSG